MDEKEIINSAKLYIETIFSDDSSGHDVQHSLRVYENAILIANSEPSCNRFIVSLAALLHDADDHKLFATENNYNARTFLSTQHLDYGTIEQICDIINSVSFSKNRGHSPQSIEGKIVQDADRLDALGAIGIARTFAYGGAHGRSVKDSLKHFYDKLFLLKDEMNTKEGKRIAEIRHEYIKAFVEEIECELNSER